MTDRGTYRVKVRVLLDREVYVHASDLEDAEEKAMREAVNLTGGREPEVIWLHQETSDGGA